MSSHPTVSGRDFVYTPPQTPLDFIHQDNEFLIANKPSGLLSVPGKAPEHQDCLESRVQTAFPNARIVHRLDMATSGLMIFAMNAKSHRHLGLHFERRHIKKTYRAHLWGRLSGRTGRVDLPLICDWPNRPLQKVDFDLGKPSQTDWEVLQQSDSKSIVRLFPVTGRSHQLRVHMLALGHPILGDRLYAHSKAFDSADRLMLHAESLELRHPDGGDKMVFTVPSEFGEF